VEPEVEVLSRGRIRRKTKCAKIRRWKPTIRNGTGFFGYEYGQRAPASAFDGRVMTWSQAQDAIRSLCQAGGDDQLDQLVKACTLHLAEIAERVRREEPSTIATFDEAGSLLVEAGGHAEAAREHRKALLSENEARIAESRKRLERAEPHKTSERKQVYHALHFGSRPKRFEAELLGKEVPQRRRGAPGEPEAMRIISGLAHQLANLPPRRVPWGQLLALVESVFPPLFTGARIPPKTMRHQMAESRSGKTYPLYRPAAARLRSAVLTYRRDRRTSESKRGGTYHGGSTDLAELKQELKRLQSPKPRERGRQR
jgi:hypothetical protein